MTDTLFPLMDNRQQRLLAGEAVVVSVRRKERRFVDPLAALAHERGLLVYIGHRTRNGWPETDWANPFSTEMKHGATRNEVIRRFEQNLLARTDLLARLGELRGRALGCWCWPESCHGDVLAALANHSMNCSGSGRAGRIDEAWRAITIPLNQRGKWK